TFPNREIIYKKNSKPTSAKLKIYTIKPNWIQFSSLSDSKTKPVYMDIEYTLHHDKWKRDDGRSLESQ
ncbi:MAG: hypothetical protein WCJ72_20115, partial [Chryseobacterium sp.]